MKFLFSLLFSTLILFGFAQKSEQRDIDSFDKIDVFGNIEVVMTAGEKEELKIESKTIDPSEVKVEVKDKLLKIKISENLFEDKMVARIYVKYKEIREITSNASAEIKVKNTIKGDKLFLTATSGGRIMLDVDLNAIELNVYQGANIDITGKTKIQESYVNTGGILSGAKFTSNEVFIKMNTGGKAEVIVEERIEASINTGADLSYFGKPEQKKLKTSLGGKITAWDE